MAFAGKKPKKPADTWTCGCPTVQPARIIWCRKCGKGQSKESK